ncbi:hypothetical protein [Bordetella petrii]|uniref:hypothetical protein n=1 Tax=Bordetella petrii TaxID=94624 RepID=UPI001A96744C|nr:hypothetical protein [Bordetella petrii]MBO1113986.1 hypothetical protein [Bordetella petrii]
MTAAELAYPPVTEQDFDALAELRDAAMRPSLERLGRCGWTTCTCCRPPAEAA